MKGSYPNRVKHFRAANHIRQYQLIELCEGLAKSDPDFYTPISRSGISQLENGYVRPMPKTATTISAALNVEIDLLFPLGSADFNRNPDGVRSRDTKTD